MSKYTFNYIYNFIYVCFYTFFVCGATIPTGQVPPLYRVFTITLRHTTQ